MSYLAIVSTADDQFDAILEEFNRAQEVFLTGDPAAVMSLHSNRDDVTLSNPLTPPRRGWAEIEEAVEQAAATVRDGRILGYDEVSRYVTPDLGYIVRIERTEAKVGGSDELSPIALRVTMIFRRENDGWKLAHRHADPITTARSAGSIIQQ